MLAKLISTKVAPYAIGGAFLIGTFGGGWLVNKFWYSKTAKAEIARQEATLSATEKALSDTKALLEKSAERAERESLARIEAENRLSQAYRDNAMLAQSRAATTTRIIERGDEIGQELKDDFAWIYYSWPNRLSDYAFGSDSAREGLPSPSSGGYPPSYESPVP